MAGETFRIELRGAKELERALRQLPKAVGKSVLRSALKKALEPTRAEAERRAPRRSGRLAGSYVIKASLTKGQRRGRRRRPGAVEISVGSTDPKAHLLEFGWKFAAPQPHFRPAWDANKYKAALTVEAEIWAALRKAAKRLHGQAARGKLSKSSKAFFGAR